MCDSVSVLERRDGLFEQYITQYQLLFPYDSINGVEHKRKTRIMNAIRGNDVRMEVAMGKFLSVSTLQSYTFFIDIS